jgi:DTW domain-containing protein YfiP
MVTTIANQVDVLILQHPEETANAKNTAGLLHLSLKNSQIAIGETFDTQILDNWLYAHERQPLLLYPDIAEYKSLGLAEPAPTLPLNKFAPHQLRLIVIDATWRKSRKMIYLNSALQKLPRMALEQTLASIYKIRKAHSENQLSTLEASCYALQQLEQRKLAYAPLLASMALFVAQQSSFVPQTIPLAPD